MAVPILAGAGAAMTVAAAIGGSSEDAPEWSWIDYPDPDPVEAELVEMQRQVANRISQQIEDANVSVALLNALPQKNMNAETREKFTADYTRYTTMAANQAAVQKGQAFGRDLDDMVDQGVLTDEQAMRQRIQSEASMAATMKVYNNRMKVAQGAMARSDYLRQAGAGLQTADITAQVDRASQANLSSAVKGGLSYEATLRGQKTQLHEANIKAKQAVAEGDLSGEFGTQVIGDVAGTMTDVYSGKVAKDALKKAYEGDF